jgi:hypothetical protein
LIGPNGEPLQGIAVAFVDPRDPSDGRCNTRSDEEGVFELPRLAGDFFLEVDDETFGFLELPVPRDSDHNWLIELPAPRLLAGTLVPPQGVSFDSLTVHWIAQRPVPSPGEVPWHSSRCSGEVRVAPDGRFEIEALPRGRCDLWVEFVGFPTFGTSRTFAYRVISEVGDFDLGVWELPAAQ